MLQFLFLGVSPTIDLFYQFWIIFNLSIIQFHFTALKHFCMLTKARLVRKIFHWLLSLIEVFTELDYGKIDHFKAYEQLLDSLLVTNRLPISFSPPLMSCVLIGYLRNFVRMFVSLAVLRFCEHFVNIFPMLLTQWCSVQLILRRNSFVSLVSFRFECAYEDSFLIPSLNLTSSVRVILKAFNFQCFKRFERSFKLAPPPKYRNSQNPAA